jgi:hypothetical protein
MVSRRGPELCQQGDRFVPRGDARFVISPRCWNYVKVRFTGRGRGNLPFLELSHLRVQLYFKYFLQPMCHRFPNDLRADCHYPLPHNGLILFNSMQAKGLAATEFDSLLRAVLSSNSAQTSPVCQAKRCGIAKHPLWILPACQQGDRFACARDDEMLSRQGDRFACARDDEMLGQRGDRFVPRGDAMLGRQGDRFACARDDEKWQSASLALAVTRSVTASRFAIEFGANQPGLSGRTVRQSAPNL